MLPESFGRAICCARDAQDARGRCLDITGGAAFYVVALSLRGRADLRRRALSRIARIRGEPSGQTDVDRLRSRRGPVFALAPRGHPHEMEEGVDLVIAPTVIAPQSVDTIHEMEIALWPLWESCGGESTSIRIWFEVYTPPSCQADR